MSQSSGVNVRVAGVAVTSVGSALATARTTAVSGAVCSDTRIVSGAALSTIERAVSGSMETPTTESRTTSAAGPDGSSGEVMATVAS